MKSEIRFSPELESLENGVDQVLQGWEVTIVGTEMPRQLPDPFSGIEVGAIGRQKVELETAAMSIEPRPKNSGMMVPSIIHHQDDLPIRPGVTKKQSQELLERYGVEGLSLAGDQASVGWTDCAENSHRLPGWGVIKHGIGIFRGNPHGAPRAMLLKMAFIPEPQVNVLSSGQFSEFFYMSPWPQGRPGRLRTGVSSDEIPDDGKASGTDGPPYQSDTGSSDDDSAVCRPRGSENSLGVEVPAGDPGRRLAGSSPLKPAAVRAFLLLEARRTHDPGNDGSSTGRSSGFAPGGRRFHRHSCRNRTEACREDDGHNETPGIVGFHPGSQFS